MSSLRRELERQKIIVGDSLKSETERVAAAKRGLDILKQMEEREVAVLKGKYEQIKAQNDLGNSTKEDIRAEMQALADLQNLQAQYTSQRKELENQQSGLIKANQDAAKARAIANQAAVERAEQERIRKSIEELKGRKKRKQLYRRRLLRHKKKR